MEGYTIYLEEYMKAITESKGPIVEDQRGFVDESGCRRYTMTYDELQALYKQMEKFVADCTQQEYQENKESIIGIFTLLHKHINAEIFK